MRTSATSTTNRNIRDCRRGVPSGGSGGRRARAGRAGRGGGVAAPRGAIPAPDARRGARRAGRRDGDDETGTSDGETSSEFGEKDRQRLPKTVAKRRRRTGPRTAATRPSPRKHERRRPPTTVWTTAWTRRTCGLRTRCTATCRNLTRYLETLKQRVITLKQRPSRGAKGAGQRGGGAGVARDQLCVPESLRGRGGGRRGGRRGAEGDAEAGRRRRCPERDATPMSPDANSIPFPSRSLLGANGPHVHAPRANGRPNSGGESRLNRVSRRYSHEFEDAGTRRTLFDESPYVNRGRGNRRAHDDFDDDFEDDDEEEGFGGAEGAEGAEDAEHTERRARRKERSVAGPPSSRYRRRVYSSASSSPAMSHAAGPTSAAPRRDSNREHPDSTATPHPPRSGGSTPGSSTTRSRGRARRPEGVGVGDGVGVGAAAAASPSGRGGPAPGPRALEPMARSPRLVTLTERSDEGKHRGVDARIGIRHRISSQLRQRAGVHAKRRHRRKSRGRCAERRRRPRVPSRPPRRRGRRDTRLGGRPGVSRAQQPTEPVGGVAPIPSGPDRRRACVITAITANRGDTIRRATRITEPGGRSTGTSTATRVSTRIRGRPIPEGVRPRCDTGPTGVPTTTSVRLVTAGTPAWAGTRSPGRGRARAGPRGRPEGS